MTAPERPWPAKTVKTLAPSAAIRSSTAFWAPLPSATMVMTAPTPMMMPSIVSTARSALLRMDEIATAKVSPSSIATAPAPAALPRRPCPPRAVVVCRIPGTPPPPVIWFTRCLHVLLRLHQARAGQHVDRVARRTGRGAPRCSRDR